jgi:hypothetical protein
MPRQAYRLFTGPLPAKERERVRSAMAGSDVAKFRDRCRAVLWSADGKTTTEIAVLLHLHRTTVIRWLEDYLRFGLRGLEVGKSPGRPRTVDAEARLPSARPCSATPGPSATPSRAGRPPR